ncbi:MAG: molybdopterin-dependent oxidoreductase [Proteobacteria bacterium]|nr:molybdopterin-dependent oxidoreductase [Pseudomonadota bacterium]
MGDMKFTGEPFSPEFRIIGKPQPRHDARDKVFGKTKYADDYALPGMLYGKVVRSKYPAAKILSIDTEEAEKLPGVEALMTAKDVPNNETVTRFGQTHEVGGFEGLYRVLAEGKVRFLGEAVALIAAETEEIAKEAAQLIKIDYEPLPGVFDPIEAMKPDAYRVGEEESNIICQYRVKKGNVEEGFSQSDMIVENTYRVPFVDHAYLEPESGVGWIDDNGVITIRVSTQVIEHFRGVADVLGLPHNQVRVIGTMVGGGFGGKEDITVESFLALLVWKTKRPAKLTYTREESILCHSKRHPYVMKYKTGASKDGKLMALEAELISDAGGYVYLSPWVLLYSTVNATGPYEIPHVKIDSYTVLTNNTFTSANRGFGAPQVCFAYESQMDELASGLNLSPLEFRKRNYLTKGKALATGRVLDHHVAFPETAERAFKALGKPAKPLSPDEKIGRGLASGMTSYGRMVFLHDTSRSYVSIEMDGSVTVRAGIQDIGGGQSSSLAQIAAEVLGVSMEDVRVYIADTALTPLAGTTTATRQLYMSGNATLMAANELKKNLLAKAGQILEARSEELEVRDKKIALKSDPDRSVALVKLVKACAGEGIPLYHVAQFNAPFRELIDFETGQGQVFPDFTFGSHAVEVAVDVETGTVRVLKLIACYDVGQAINPLSVEGQLEGGAIYGFGYGLTEQVIMEKGMTLTPSLSEILIPTALDAPEVETIVLESGDGVGPFGAKGIGEPSCCSIAPAIANAVSDALGVRIVDLPLTPEKIIKALKKI